MEIKSIEYQISEFFPFMIMHVLLEMSKGPRNMRRGVLMSVLQESAKSIPLWVGKVDDV